MQDAPTVNYDETEVRVRKPVLDIDISAAGVAAIKGREGLMLHAYEDIGGTRTIGYGRAYGVRAGESITEMQATEMLYADLNHVKMVMARTITVPLAQCEADALYSFIYNIGEEKWARSTVLKRINEGDYRGAAIHMSSWHHVHGKVSKGLWNRRRDEIRQFADDPHAI